jgi:hypothetical protein
MYQVTVVGIHFTIGMGSTVLPRFRGGQNCWRTASSKSASIIEEDTTLTSMQLTSRKDFSDIDGIGIDELRHQACSRLWWRP